MGLFDEAIRDHLELKRRHGADLQEIARIERDTLGRGDRAADAELGSERNDPPVDPGAAQRPLPGVAGSWGDRDRGAHIDQDAQETTEIDIGLAGSGRAGDRHDGAYDQEHEAEWPVMTAEQPEEFEWEIPRAAGR